MIHELGITMKNNHLQVQEGSRLPPTTPALQRDTAGGAWGGSEVMEGLQNRHFHRQYPVFWGCSLFGQH